MTSHPTAGPSERFVNLPSGRYRYLEWGDPTRSTVVLLHGRTGAVETWEEVGAGLSADHRVVAFEQRGHGASPWSAGGDYRLIDFLTDYEHFVDAVVGGPHVLVGHSMGACTSLVFAARHPDLVLALVLEDGGPPGPTVKRAVEEASRSCPASFADWEGARDHLRQESPHLVGPALDRRTDLTFRPGEGGRYWWRADVLGLLGESHRRHDELFDVGQWQAVADLVVPTVLLRAENPPCLLDESVLERIRDLNPAVEIRRFATSHELHEEIPQEFVAVVRDHARSAAARRS